MNSDIGTDSDINTDSDNSDIYSDIGIVSFFAVVFMDHH